MIQVICDRCGVNCGRIAFDVRVSNIENPTPLYANDIGDPKITSDRSSYRFILCQKCYRNMGFPNIFDVCETGELKFRKGDEDEEL